MKKGIVMQIGDTYLTLLTPDGQFMQASKINNQYEVGEEIQFTPLKHSKKAPRLSRFISMKPLLAAAAVLLLLIGSFLPIYKSDKAYAYMSIDANPSIEMGINKQMQVIKLTPFNADGKKILSEIGNWKKKKVNDIARNIFEQMKKDGYLKADHLVVISTVRTEKAEEKVQNQLSKNINDIKAIVEENHLKFAVLTGTEKEMEKAHKLGMTTGKYKETQMPLNRCRKKSQNSQESWKKQSPINSQNFEKTSDSNKASVKNERGNTATSGNQSEVKQSEKSALPNRISTVTGRSNVQNVKKSNPAQSNSKKPAVKAKIQQKVYPTSSKKDNAVTNQYLNWGQAKKNSGYLNWGQAKKNRDLNWGQAKKHNE